MRAHESSEQRSAATRIEGLLTWLGGGHRRELGERHERATHAVAGAVVALGASLAWLIATLALHSAARGVPLWTIVALMLVFGLLVGAVIRGTAGGPGRGRPGVAGRAAVAVSVGVVVGELAALVVFGTAIDRHLDARALRTADSAPAVARASATLDQARAARSALDTTVDQARGQLDQALEIARCEYHPTPSCPQTRITGVPGQGPETRTANELLADSRSTLNNALAARERQAPDLDARVARAEQAVAEARHGVVADAGRGLGARWVAMNEMTAASPGALVLRMMTIAFFALLYLLPLILRMWRGETTHDRHATARADRERAELDADTAIAIKRAEVRRAAEIMWAEHQLTQTRLAIEAQAEIDREQQRRRVIEAIEAPVHASSERPFEPLLEPAAEDIYLPIAAEAEAASRAVAQLPAGGESAEEEAVLEMPLQLPAPVEPARHAVDRYEERRQDRPDQETPVIPSIPDATRAAARWIRPLVPPFVARVIDNTTQPFRSARQVFEEVEEIAFSLKRTRKVTVGTESSDGSEAGGRQVPHAAGADDTREDPAGTNRIHSSRGRAAARHHATEYDATEYDATDYEGVGTAAPYASLNQRPSSDLADLSAGPSGRNGRHELVERQGPRELRGPEGPRQLPPGK